MEILYKTKKTGIITDIAIPSLIGCAITGILYLITYYLAIVNAFFMAITYFMVITLILLAFYATTENEGGFLKEFFVTLLILTNLSVIRFDVTNIDGSEEVLSSKILNYEKRKYCVFYFNDKQLRAAIDRHNQRVVNKSKNTQQKEYKKEYENLVQIEQLKKI